MLKLKLLKPLTMFVTALYVTSVLISPAALYGGGFKFGIISAIKDKTEKLEEKRIEKERKIKEQEQKDDDIVTTAANQSPNTPAAPTGSANGLINTSYTFTATATDPDGDQVQYRFDWGDGSISDYTSLTNSGNSLSLTHSYANSGTYNIKAQAMDSKGLTSAWSDSLRFLIPAPTTPNQPPNTPSTPGSSLHYQVAIGFTGIPYSFSTSATDPDGDQVQYRFDWGDGSISDYTSLTNSGDSLSLTHSYTTGGTYSIKAQARDSKGATSAWSDSNLVGIAERSIISIPPNIPSTPCGPSMGLPGTSYSFSTYATDIFFKGEDQVQYRFDWGDGTISDYTPLVNSGSPASMTHSYASVNTYNIKAQARNSTGATSAWSDFHSIIITTLIPPQYHPNTPSTPTGRSYGQIDASYSFSTAAFDPNGDQVQYRFDWGDGTISDYTPLVNSGSPASMTHSYASEGIYNIKAQARNSTGATSAWSDIHSIIITTIIMQQYHPNTPSTPTGRSDGEIVVSYSFSTAAFDPNGDQVQYRFDWGDGTISDYTPLVNSSSPASMTHSYATPHTYSIKAQARDSTGKTSAWSAVHSIVIRAINIIIFPPEFP